MWCKEKKKRYGSIWGKCLLQGSAHSWQVNEIYQNKICLKKKKGAYTTERRKMEKYWGSPRGIPFLYMGGKLLDNLKVKRSRGCVLSDDILVISSSWMPHLFFFFLRNGRANQSATWIGGGKKKISSWFSLQRQLSLVNLVDRENRLVGAECENNRCIYSWHPCFSTNNKATSRRDKRQHGGANGIFFPPRRPKSWAPWRYYSTYVPSRREEMCIAMLRHWHFTHI